MTLRIPPLRERREDIGLLCDAFLREFTRRADLPPKTFALEALECLRGRPVAGQRAPVTECR